MLPSKNLSMSRVVFVDQETPIRDAVKVMIDHHISSILVCNAAEDIVGILTERDVVRKFALLEMQDKLTHCVNTVMSRPVLCARATHLYDDVMDLHLKHKIRHFPIISGSDSLIKRSVVGIISVTDIARALLMEKSAERDLDASKDAQRIKHASSAVRALDLLVHEDDAGRLYHQLFEVLGYQMSRVRAANLLQLAADDSSQGKEISRALIFDLDSWPPSQLRELLPAAQKHYRTLLMTTSDPRLLANLKQYLKDEQQEVVIKPLDVSYCDWLLSQRLRTS